ncbi:MAG: N-methyl-L-tryptophan oxidase [Rubrobacteraceae bacterium]|nr:N-methyl-L-tryptophan oxidase [Rubrobacteraceae bacterium]MDQ3436232.1 N-methyl-L-tryptophan oxidase [Actinomycetota bacterium]
MYDVIVAGLGGMGSSAAYHLAGRGKHVLGLERHTPAHDRGSSHGQSRIIRLAYSEDPAYVPLVIRAYELWERLERETGEDLMTITGGLMIGPPGTRFFEGSKESAEKYDLPYEVLDSAGLKRRYPVFEPTPDTVALFEEKAGFLRPEASVKAHLDRAASLGADLKFGEEILSWQPTRSGVRVETKTGTYEAERLVVSAGAWAPKLLADLGLPLEVTRQILFWFDPKGGIERFLPDRFPIFIWEPEDGNSFYAIPAHDGPKGGVKVAFFRADGKPADPETIDREVHDEEVEFIRSYLARYVPDLDGKFLYAKTCMYTNTPDEHFVISVHPKYPQVAIAAGFSGHGYKFCSVVGEILAALVTEDETPHPIDLFSPARLAGAKRG